MDSAEQLQDDRELAVVMGADPGTRSGKLPEELRWDVMRKINVQRLIDQIGQRFLSYIGIALSFSSARLLYKNRPQLMIIGLIILFLGFSVLLTAVAEVAKERARRSHERKHPSNEFNWGNAVLLTEFYESIAFLFQVYSISLAVFYWLEVFGDEVRGAEVFDISKITATVILIELIVGVLVFSTRY